VCRPGYVALLFAYLDARRDQLCPDHQARLATNPMRVLDCKRAECRSASEGVPRLFDHLCEPCRAHFDRVQEGLSALGITAILDHRLVRGFDYYTRTTFEFASGAIDAAQNALGGGGRYDGLVEMLGGEPTPGVGFGIGVERVLIACEAESSLPSAPPGLDAFVVDVAGGDAARDLTATLRLAGLRADRAFDARSMKAQMKLADRSGAAVALIVGPKEVAEGTVVVRPLRAEAAQRAVARDDVVAALLVARDGEAHG